MNNAEKIIYQKEMIKRHIVSNPEMSIQSMPCIWVLKDKLFDRLERVQILSMQMETLYNKYAPTIKKHKEDFERFFSSKHGVDNVAIRTTRRVCSDMRTIFIHHIYNHEELSKIPSAKRGRVLAIVLSLDRVSIIAALKRYDDLQGEYEKTYGAYPCKNVFSWEHK